MQHAARMVRFTGVFGAVMLVLGMGAWAQALQPNGNPLHGLAQLKAGETMRSSSCNPDWENMNGDAVPIAPGGELVIADLEGPGVITHIWNTVAAMEREYSRLLVIRMYWDGEESPSVEAPLGDFFGIGHGKDVPYESLPMMVSSEGRARNCYWPMPFAKSAKITITNEGKKHVQAFFYYVDWQKLPALPPDTAYFHASYRQEHPTLSGRNYLIADLEGRGHYVGTLLNVRQHTASWWGEGDDFWFIDGEKEPRLRGTGSEDYFCDAWGFREFTGPFYGVPIMQGYDAWDLTTAYRWHITDPVNFQESLRLEIEHKGVTFNEAGEVKSGFEERTDDFSSVAYWYQLEPHKPFAALPEPYDRVYYDWSNLREAEALMDAARVSSGTLQKQAGHWSGGEQLFWMVDEAEQTLEIPIEFEESGTYQMLLLITHSWDYGKVRFELDGKPVGEVRDTYNPTVVFEEMALNLGVVEAGTHTLRVVNEGKQPESEGFFFGLDAFMLTKLTGAGK